MELLEERALLSVAAPGDLGTAYHVPRTDLSEPGGYLTGPSTGAPLDVAMAYLTSHAGQLGVSSGDILNSAVTDQYSDSATGMTHLYLRQELNGIPVVNATLNINVAVDGRVLSVGAAFVPGLSALEGTSAVATVPTLTATEALRTCTGSLGLTSTSTAVAAPAESGDLLQSTTLTDSGLSLDPIPAKLQYVAAADGVQLAWEFVLRTPDGQHWYDVYADSSSGKALRADDWVDRASYNVFAIPTETPDDGTRTIVTDPYDLTASPYGWHDTNGTPGAEYTDTRGNNVFAQDDWDDNDSGGARPNGGAGLNFDFPLDLAQDPHIYVDAAVTNLFYWTNLSHDIHYKYGFDEAAGNFQQTNYSGWGLGNDPVQAEAQDGGGMNNANFATPPDGMAPRTQMYEFDMTNPHRDGDLESEIMVHEYGHGVSNRLVGGPSNVWALNAWQSGGMGEGWSDWWGLMFTQKTTDAEMDSYPIGNYVLGQPTTGGGIRRYPYSFDMSIDPLTYNDYNGGWPNYEVHNAGEIWCSALWDLNWLLIDKYGFNPNLAEGYTGATSAGNILALQLVMDSLKLMPVYPTFLDGRNSLLWADMILTGGENEAEIWTAFARRGMGLSAYDGGDADAISVIAAFDMPIFNTAPQLNPALGALSLRDIQEGDAASFGTRVGAILTSGGVPEDQVIFDADVGAKKGIAIFKADTTYGSWDYTTNNGITWEEMGKPSSGSARLLSLDAGTRVRFVPNPGYNGRIAPALTFRAWDQTTGTNGGVGDATKTGRRTAFSTGTGSASITVTSVNDAPVLDASLALSLASIDENVPDAANPGTLVSDILASGGVPAVTDLDSGDPQGIAVTAVDTTQGIWQYSTDGGTWIGIDQGVSTTSALLLASDSLTRLRFLPGANFSGTVAQGVGFRAWDQTSGAVGEYPVDTSGNGGTTAFSTAIASASITVNWVNQAPVLRDPLPEQNPVVLSMGTINEDDLLSAGTPIAEILLSNGAERYPIQDVDAAASPGAGIAVIGADTTNGAWQFSTDNGAHWLPVESPDDSHALLLASDDANTRLRFRPRLDFNSATAATPPSLTFRAWDQYVGTSGSTFDIAGAGAEETSAFSVATGTIGIAVRAVNDPPIFALVKGANQTAWEGQGPQSATLVASFAPGPATAIDEQGTQHVDFFVAAPDNPALFAADGQPAITIEANGTGTLTYTPAPNAHGTTTVTVQAHDDGGTGLGGNNASTPQTFTITIQWVNQAPAFVATNLDQSVDQGAPRQVVPHWAQGMACGPNDPLQGLSFFVRPANLSDLAKFIEPPAVGPDGTLTYQLAPTAIGSIPVIVQLQDDGGTSNGGQNASASVTFTINIIPINQKPVAFPQQFATDANRPVSFTLWGDDGNPEVGQPLTFAMKDYPDSRLGTITSFDGATGAVVFTPNPGAMGLAAFTFTVTDHLAGGAVGLTSDPASVQIQIDPVVQVPTGTRDGALVLHRAKNNRVQLDYSGGRGTQRLFDQPLDAVSKLTIIGSDAKGDQLTVDFTSGGSFTLPEVVFNGGADGTANTLAFRGTKGLDNFVVESARAVADDVPVAFQNVGQVKLDGLSGNDTYVIASFARSVRISDSSGTDGLDFSQLDLSQLPPGTGIAVDLSRTRGQTQTPIQGVPSQFWITGTLENLFGSTGNDLLKGSSAANVIHGGLGNDTIYGGGGKDLLFGDGGDDVLYADAGLAVLLGGEGSDTLNAGKKRSILIGGAGADTLAGSTGHTILIGGTTAYDNNDTALMAILKDWGGGGSFKTRVTRLKNGIGPDHSIFLRLNSTVLDDLASDALKGGTGYDWFLPFTGEPGDSTQDFDGKKDITG